MASHTTLRKLETYEINKNKTELGKNFIMTVQVRSKIDLFAHLDQIKQAIQTLKSMHKFLRAKVVKIDQDYYFIIDENSLANRNLENVHFLRIKSNLEPELNKRLIDENVLFDLVHQKLMGDIINFETKEHELLWRLIILELKKDETDIDGSGVFYYEFIWHLHHIIGDGISARENLPYLIDLIDKTLKSECIQMKDSSSYLYPGTENMFSHELNLGMQLASSQNPKKIMRPGFVDPEKAKHTSRAMFDSYFRGIDIDRLEFELVDLNTEKSFATLAQLVRFSREVINFKPRTYIINEYIFPKLLNKCKQEKIKMTSCLNMINLVALLRLFKRYNYKTDEVCMYNAVNLRQFRPPTVIDNFPMCYAVGALINVIHDEFGSQVDDDEKMLSQFWQVARKYAVAFDERVRNDPLKFVNPQFRKFEDDNEMMFHIAISNIGIMETSRTYECFRGASPTFKIENSFTSCSFGKPVNRFLFTSYAMTVSDRLCCCVCYNAEFFDYTLIDEFVVLLKHIINKLIA